MSTQRNVSLSETAFLTDWAQLSEFGAVEGTQGVDRQAASIADGEQRRWFAKLLESQGFTVERDHIGNMFGFMEIVPGAPYVLSGSHLDSQPTAGRFDGAYGVLASAYACSRVAEEVHLHTTRPKFNLVVVNWFNEEGSRFKPSMMGSSVFSRKLEAEVALATSDSTGVTVQEALDAVEERGHSRDFKVAAYAEIHVQQGRSMEQDGLTIGLVDATWGAHKFEFKICGEQAHSGSTLMSDRKDALLAASRLIVAARELVDFFDSGMLHTSVGELDVYPNSPVVVASEVNLLLDLRSPSRDVLTQAAEKLIEAIHRIKLEDGVEVEVVAEHAWDQNPYPETGVKLAQQVATNLGLANDRVMTIAGHDSTNMKDIAPTVMLFVPSVEGVSHNVREQTKDQDMIDGLSTLTGVIRLLVQGELD